MATPFLSLLPLLLLVNILLSSPRCSAQNGELQEPEANALYKIIPMLNPRSSYMLGKYACQYEDLISCRCEIEATMNEAPRNICVVTALMFNSEQLDGEISPAVGNLPYLTVIDFSYHNLHGEIPNTLAQLLHLETLDLSYNQLEGRISNIFGKNQQLTDIDVSYNFLQGQIPPSLGGLLNLTELYLNSNQLTGDIPSQIGNITSLVNLNLENNELDGTIPPQLGKLGNLKIMLISNNNFTGKLSREFEGLAKLEIFDVRGNDLFGPVPDFIAKWRYLKELNLMGNKFKGVLPSGVFKLKDLTYLWITDLQVRADNSFPALSESSNLIFLTLRNCFIVGKIPKNISLKNLRHLDLSFNNLNGEIPSSLQKLDFLCLTRNNFSGPFPDWTQNSTQSYWDFSYNHFIKSSSYNSLDYLNTFTPTELPSDSSVQNMNRRCPEVKYDNLYINCGGNNATIGENSYEKDTSNLPFYISGQKWAYSSSGEFMYSYFNSTMSISKSGVSIRDAQLYTSARISPLALDYYGLCLRNGKYNVTLHFAEIVFAEKDNHSLLGERIFDIFIQGDMVAKDFNIKAEAQGPYKEVLKTHQAEVTNNTLNIHLYWAGKGSTNMDPKLYGPLISAISVSSDYKTDKLSHGEIAGITTSCVALLLLLLLALLWNLGYMGHKKNNNFELEGEALKEKKLTFQNIVHATEDFCSKMVIGSGGSGTVYKAVLRDGSVLAVKKILSSSIKGLDEFLNEVRTLQSLKNENLVQLLGWYTRDGQLLLIYEYMENGSLQKTFFDKLELFSWDIRYRICLQIAKGLEYLHEMAKPKIIHRDITLSNILLDENLNAKISDFGLARFYNEEQGTITTKLHGTHGYMAPEYALRGILNEKIDVYSYGVVVLELVSGKSNATRSSGHETDFLLDQAYVLEKQGNILDLIDIAVKNKPGYQAKQASKVLDLAMMCTNQSPSLRPTMSEVVSVLENEKTIKQISDTNQCKPGYDSERVTTSGNPISPESTNTSFSGISPA